MKTLLQQTGSLELRAESQSFRSRSFRRRFVLSALRSRLSAFLFLLVLAPLARAQWQTPVYTLHGGWNAIYLHGDATHASPDTLFASNSEILSVWRWIPNPNPAQTGGSSLVPTASSPEWSVWVRGQPSQTTLASLPGQNAYLIRCSGTASDTYSLTLPQRPLPPRNTWVRNGANLLGFPSRFSAGSTYPIFTNYFATFPAAIAANTTIYKYVGGEVGPGNPIQIFSPAIDRVDRNQAYWFDATVVGSFYAPLELTPSNLDGLTFGRTGAIITVRVRNRTAAPVTLTIAPASSLPAPSGQETVVAPVPITRRTFVAATTTYTDTLITAAYTETIPPQTSVELTFGIDRAQMTGAVGALYASFLRFTDSGNLLDVYLPASARAASLAGLWVGDVAVSGVSSRVMAGSYSCDITRTVGSDVTTVTSGGVQSGTTTIGPATLPSGTGGTLTYQWRKNAIVIAGATSANLALTSTERTESGAFGTTTPRSYPLRVLLHVDDNGVARLLSQVFMGQLAPDPFPLGLCTRETGLKADAKATATRLVSVTMPLDTEVSTGSGSVALGATLVRTINVGFNDRTNPFVHAYHPDHDNKDARGAALSAGVESYTISRACSFIFTTTPPAGTSTVGWGATVIGGSYSETVTGLHKDSITVTGTFTLRRVSEIGTITLN
jgi:hypothetical protein